MLFSLLHVTLLRVADFLISHLLAENQIGDDGITRLAQTFNNTTLTSLDLHQNKVGNSGAAAIGSAITKCPCYQVRKCR